VEDLSSVLEQISLKEKQPERKTKESILNIRKRFVKKSTIVDLESDSESESIASQDPAASFPSVDYTSADDGDVDSPVISKVKSKTNQVTVQPKCLSSFNSQSYRSSEADDEHAFASEIKSRAGGNTITSISV
jgi:hypothetical protein